MSYNRRFTRQVAVPYHGSKTVSYPASQTSGTIVVDYSGVAYEDVEVDIQVDTTPFDASVLDCNEDVHDLTDSVGVMNAAQCLAIEENADKISKSIIDGFFHTVRTDLGTQKVELEQIINARLLLLHQQAATLKEKQQKMADDYARTSARYQKIFSDLNNELSIRIHELDQPVFNLVREVDTQSDRMLHTDMVQTAVTMSKESSMLQAQINAATVKKHALEAMDMAQRFLTSKAVSERMVKSATIEGSGDEVYMIPACYMRTESENSVEKKCLVPEYYSRSNEKVQERLCDTLEDYVFPARTESETEQLNSYVQTEIANNISGDDAHSVRVRNMINKMLNQ